MSSMEFNMGKLIPIEMNEKIAKKFLKKKGITTISNGYTVFEHLRDEFWDELIEINSKWYRVEFKVNGAGDCSGLELATTQPDGSIEFMTYHYNGGGSMEEVIESSLKHDGELQVWN